MSPLGLAAGGSGGTGGSGGAVRSFYNAAGGIPGRGGGALQISANQSIELRGQAVVSGLGGWGGEKGPLQVSNHDGGGGGGGGGGGTLWLESPSIALLADDGGRPACLSAEGGGGGGPGTNVVPGESAIDPRDLSVCPSGSIARGGNPGVMSDLGPLVEPVQGGGGGGGHGRIVVRTAVQPPGVAALVHPAAAYVPLTP